jgi:hypothetical protein
LEYKENSVSIYTSITWPSSISTLRLRWTKLDVLEPEARVRHIAAMVSQVAIIVDAQMLTKRDDG